MSRRPIIESLESRRLLTGGLTAAGSPVTVASITGRASATATSVGTNDSLIAYVKSNTVKAVITDAAGNILVPEFTLSTGGQSANPFSAMTSTTDSNGNAVIVYPVGTSNRNLYIVRVNSAGTVINAPQLVTSVGINDQSAPALAAGPNGQIAVVYINAPSIGASTGNGIFARVFDSTDTPLFTETQLSDAPTNAPGGELLTHPAVIYNPNTSKYLAAWDLQDLTSAFANLREAIDDRVFTSAGVLGTDPEVASSPTDTFSTPCFIYNPDDLSMTLCYSENSFGPSPNFDFQGSTLNASTVDNLGFPGLPSPWLTSPDHSSEFILSSVVNPDDAPATVILNNGIYNGSGISSSGYRAITATPTGIILADNSPVLPASQFFDPTVFPSGTNSFTGASFVYNPNNNTTTIASYPLNYTAPVVTTVTMSITNVNRSADGATPPQMIVTATLSQIATSDVTVHIMDATDGVVNSSVHPFNYNVSTTLTIHQGERSATYPVDIFPYQPGGTLDGTVSIEASASVQVTNPTVTGTVTTLANTTNVHGTATPGHPFVATDPDGTKDQISTSDGKVDITTLPDGNLKVVVTKTNGKTSVKIITNPLGGKPDRAADSSANSRFNIEQLIISSPIGTLNAATTDVTGTLTLKGVSSLTLGNLTSTHTVSLGSLNNAVLKFGSLTSAALTSTGSIKSLSVSDWLGGSLSAGTVGTLSSSSDFDANLTLTSLTSLTVKGSLGGTSSTDIRTLRASKSLGSITASSLRNASLLAGTKSAAHTLPTKRSSFTSSTSSISSITLKGGSFSNTIIAAPVIGTLKLAGLISTNPTPFGIAAERISSYSLPPKSAKNISSPKLLDSSNQFSARTI